MYIERSEGGRGLISIEDCVLIEKYCLHDYVSNSQEELIKESVAENVNGTCLDKDTVINNRKRNFKENQIHSVYLKATEFRDPKNWNWLRNGDLKKATEGTLMAAQEKINPTSKKTRSIQHRIKTENLN